MRSSHYIGLMDILNKVIGVPVSRFNMRFIFQKFLSGIFFSTIIEGIRKFSQFLTPTLLMLTVFLQVNLCQKLLFLYQLTHNMTTNCSLFMKIVRSEYLQNMLCTQIVVFVLFWHSEQFWYSTCSADVASFWKRFTCTTICQQIWQMFDPSPQKISNILNGWSLSCCVLGDIYQKTKISFEMLLKPLWNNLTYSKAARSLFWLKNSNATSKRFCTPLWYENLHCLLPMTFSIS